MTRQRLFGFSLGLGLFNLATFASAQTWGQPLITGHIERKELPEASGIAQSKIFPNRLYHVNDSGSVPAIVTSDLQGANARTIPLNLSQLVDAEDLDTGPCPDNGFCLYVADIGDNDEVRPFVRIYIFREELSYASTWTPAFTVDLTYPDGLSHNAESFALHPAGYAYVLSKEIPSVFYRFPLTNLEKHAAIVLEKQGFLDLKPWLAGTDKAKKIVPTSMAIRSDGEELVVITRAAGISIDLDLNEALRPGHEDLNQILLESNAHSQRLPMIQLPQSEAIAFRAGDQALIYSSEIAESGGTSVPLVTIPKHDTSKP